MSGALVELVSKGVQDAYLTGKPEVSFFRQTYKRHTNFAQKPVKLDFIGTCDKNQMVTLKIPRKGDLLGYIFINLNPYPNPLSADSTAGNLFGVYGEDPTIFELYIGGQLIDRQDGFYMNQLWQKFLIDSSSKNFSYTTHYDPTTPSGYGIPGLPPFIVLFFPFFPATINPRAHKGPQPPFIRGV